MYRRSLPSLLTCVATLSLGACGPNEGAQMADADGAAQLDEAQLLGVDTQGQSSGGVAIRPTADASLCLDVTASNTADGTPVQIYKCNGTDAQRWTQKGNFLVAFGNKCLNVKDGGTRDGTRLQIWTCDPATSTDKNNMWNVGGGTVRWQKDLGKCLDVTDGVYQSKTPVQMYGCSSGNRNQQWSLSANAGAPANNDKPAPSPTSTLNLPRATNDYSSVGGGVRYYSGPAINFPNDPAKWDSWDRLWSRASSQMPNTAAQNEWIRQAIMLESQITGMDPRFILSVIMQESSGNARVRTTNNGVNNPGLMQSHNGASFYDNGDGGRASIFQMVKDGCEGTRYGDGLIQGIRSTNNYFAAARMYNSGQMDKNNLSNAMGATASYCTDLANRVMGRM